MNPLTQSKNTTILPLLIALACFALSPQAQAVCQEGCLTNENTVLGNDALLNNTGISNTAIGASALYFNTAGPGNTAIGLEALYSNTMGSANTAMGVAALYSNTTGITNTATGVAALYSNTTGFYNTANGANALGSNTTGFNNTANGLQALFNNTTGFSNTANGISALNSNTTGNFNTANGVFALYYNTTGSNNIAFGFQAGINLTTGGNNIDIGNAGVAGESRTIRIGTRGTHRNTSIAGISAVTVPNGVGVIIDTNGHLGTVVSSARFKDNIKPMEKVSEAILALKPVTFHYKQELDPEGIPQFGLVAEEVEKINPDLVARDADGKAYTVRYEAVNAMLLNEFLKEHRIVQELKSIAAKQEANAAKQEATIARQQKQIEALTAGLQKVSAQVEMSRRAPQMVVNNQ
jgi:trimeric autotransporter adhesin